MITSKLKWLSCATALILSLGAAVQAQENNALLEALVKKGILTDQEAEDIRVGLVQEYSATPAGKLNISSSITELKLSGDARLRYQYDNRDLQQSKARGQGNYANDFQRSRWRFRLRLNADIKFAGPFFAGVGLETGQASDSGNQTFDNGFDDYNIYISKVFLGWNVTDWLTVIAGKQKNPFYTTDLVWDSDINPAGITESFTFNKLFGWETVESGGGYDKDGKTMLPASSERIWSEPRWTVNLVAGQFIFDDNNEYAGPDNDASTDAYLFVTQLQLGYKFTDSLSAMIVPGWMIFNAADLAGLQNEQAFGSGNGVTMINGQPLSGETRNLNILLAPGDISFKLAGLPASFYWDFAYNIEGSERARDIYEILRVAGRTGTFDHAPEDDFAWLVGFQIGKNKKAGDWSFNVNYRQIGIASIDPNLNDSDFALSRLNVRGFKTGVAYNFTDFLIGGVTYFYAWNLRDNLFQGQATNRAAIADVNVEQTVQVDLSWKF